MPGEETRATPSFWKDFQSRGYCLEMICADFLAGANLDNGDPETLLFSMTRFFKFLSEDQQQEFLEGSSVRAS